MSLDDYINRVPQIPPKVDFDEQQSSLDVDYPPLDPGRAHLVNTSDQNRPANSTIPRFSLPYWTAKHTDDAVAVVLPSGTDRLTLTSTFRTNKERSALLWESEDTRVHQLTSYVENVNYQNLVLAFQHNTDNPDQFTCTITNTDGTFVYRLVPYGYNPVTKKYECLDTKFSTGKTYSQTVYDNTKTNIAGVPYAGRTDYIFILDFNDLRQNHNYTGSLIDPRKVSSIALDVASPKHALGSSAFVARIIDLGGGTCQMELGGVEDTAKLTAGDVISGLLTYINNAETQVTVNSRWVVVSSTGFGSSARSVLVQGSMPGGYLDFQALSCRDLQEASVVAEENFTHTFGNFLLTGTGVRTMGKRTYTQPINGLAMVSDLDQDHTMQPKRLADSVVALGYRQDWNLSLGSKSYYRASTTLQKEGDAAITDTESTQWPVLYAGEAQLNGQYVVGRAPGRGIDKLHDDVTASWDSNFAGIMPYNGTTKNSSVEAAGMPVGGTYWWDLELDLPGPAALNAVAAMRGRMPKGIVWCLGDSDAVAIDEPGDRIPVPTIARAKLATEKLFAYFRSLWGATLPIWIQEQAWGWAGTNPVDPTDPGTGVPIQRGAPTYLRVRRTAYGDLLFEWKSYDLDPVLATFRVEIYNPLRINEVLHSFTVPGIQEEGGYVYADWSIEDNGPVRALVDNANDVWGGIRWRVVSISALGQVPSVTKSGLVPIDNTLIERVIVCTPNLYMGNYFTKMSDPTNGNNRRDLWASTIMRKEYTDKLNMRRLKVMPLDASDEDRGDEDTELEDQKFGRILKDWWDVENGFPGPSLLAMITKVATLGRPVAHFVQGQPGEVELMRGIDPVVMMTQIGQIRQAYTEMLAFLRTFWAKPNLNMWLQGATSIWMGMPGVAPININQLAATAMKKAQSQHCLASSDFFLGSYVPGSDNHNNFQLVGLERKYPTPATYYATAREMGESMALNIDRAVDDTGCPDMVLNVTPEYSVWGTGWSALYGAPGNGKYIVTGSVDIPNVRLAHMLFASTGPVTEQITITGSGVAAPSIVAPFRTDFNGLVVAPSGINLMNPTNPTWGIVTSEIDTEVDPNVVTKASDSSLVMSLGPTSDARLASKFFVQVFNDSDGGVLVHETTLYRAGGTSTYGLWFYQERPVGNYLTDIFTVYPPEAHPAPFPPYPANPGKAFEGNDLRFVLTAPSGIAPYFNATSIAVWGNAEDPIHSIKLSKNGGAPVTVVPQFVPMSSTPGEFTGQWRVDLNEAVLELDADDVVGVTFMGVCDHDTGPGCDNPIIIEVDGMEYNYTPRFFKNEEGKWSMFFASTNNGAFDPVGSVDPSDLPVLAMMSTGLVDDNGAELFPITHFSFWGNGTEGYTHVTIEYRDQKKSFPLTYTPSPQPNVGVWNYGVPYPEMDMSMGGGFKATIHGGQAAAREVEICAICVGCPEEDTYDIVSKQLASIGEIGDTSSNLITVFAFDYLKELVSNGSTGDCPASLNALKLFAANGESFGAAVGSQTISLKATELEITHWTGFPSTGGGGFTWSYSLVRADGVVVDAGWLTYSQSAEGGIIRDESHLTLDQVIIGSGPGEYVQLVGQSMVAVGGTIFNAKIPALNIAEVTDPECLLGVWKPVCCHFAYPDPEPIPQEIHVSEISASAALGPMQVNGIQYDRPATDLAHFFDIMEGANILTTNPQDAGWSSNFFHYILLEVNDNGTLKPIEQVWPDWNITVEAAFGCTLAGQVGTGVVTPKGPIALVSSGTNEGNGPATVTITDGHGTTLRTFTVNGRASSYQLPALRSFKAGATMGGPVNSMFTGSTLAVTGPRAYSANWQFQANPLNQFAVGSVNTRNSGHLTTVAQQEIISPAGYKIWLDGVAMDAIDVTSFETSMICGVQVQGSPSSPTLLNIGVSEGECTPIHPGAGVPNHPVFAAEDIGDLFAPWGTLEGATGSTWSKSQTFTCEYGTTSAPGDIPG